MQPEQVIEEYIEKIKKAHLHSVTEQKALCEELLQYAADCGNQYGIGYAYVYLADYCVGSHDLAQCPYWLQVAEEFVSRYEYMDLLMTIYNLHGIYLEYMHDDMGAFEYFLKGLKLSRELDDVLMQFRFYNNVATSFDDKRDFDTAFSYYSKAFEVMKSKEGLIVPDFCPTLLYNIINCSIARDNKADVERFCQEAETFFRTHPELQSDPSMPLQKAVILCYAGKEEEALSILRENLEKADHNLNINDIIDLYPRLFWLLLNRKEKHLAEKVLSTLNASMQTESPQAKQAVKEMEIRYYQCFGLTGRLARAYREYYEVSKEALDSLAKNRIDAMKEKLHYFEIRQELRQFQEMTYVDPLCGLYNRRYYSEKLEQSMKDLKVAELGIIVIDIDFFKEYNDHYGHDFGDEVLKQVSGCLKCGDGRIIPCRYGGDEFTCICENVTEEEIRAYLDGVYERLSGLSIEHLDVGKDRRVTVSCGYSLHPKDQIGGVGQLFHEADRALYHAKVKGKNRYSDFQKEQRTC